MVRLLKPCTSGIHLLCCARTAHNWAMVETTAYRCSNFTNAYLNFSVCVVSYKNYSSNGFFIFIYYYFLALARSLCELIFLFLERERKKTVYADIIMFECFSTPYKHTHIQGNLLILPFYHNSRKDALALAATL